ncbi:hypothetical protein WAG12_26440, partial [Bacillus cereus]
MADAPKLNGNEYLDESYWKINQAIDNANEALKPAGSDRIAAGAVTNSKIADNVITYRKMKNPFGVILHSNSLEINFQTNKVNILKTLWVYDENYSVKYGESGTTAFDFTSLDLLNPNDYGSYRLYVDLDDGGKVKIKKGYEVSGTIITLAWIYRGRVLGNPDGILVINKNGTEEFQPKAANVSVDAYIYSNDSINIDMVNKKVVWYSNLNVLYDKFGQAKASGDGEVLFGDTASSSWARNLYLNKKTGTLKVYLFNKDKDRRDDDRDEVFLGYFYGSGEDGVFCGPFCNEKKVSIDGLPYELRKQGRRLPMQYAWSGNRFVIPKDLYLVKDVDYKIHAQNFNYNTFTNNSDLLFEIGSPTESHAFKDSCTIKSPLAVDVDTQVVGIYNNDLNNALTKDIRIHIVDPSTKQNKAPRILFIGDSVTYANIPGLVK